MNTIDLNKLLEIKRAEIEKNKTFIMDLIEFMLEQELKPVHPVYSQNRFMHYYESGSLKIKLFEQSVPRQVRFAVNRYFSIRVQRDHDPVDYPLCWLEVEYLVSRNEEVPVVEVQIEKAMENPFHVFVPEGEDGWVQHMIKIIENKKERMVNIEKSNEQKQVDHYKKLLRM